MHFQGQILSQKFKKTFNSSDQAFIFEVFMICHGQFCSKPPKKASKMPKIIKIVRIEVDKPFVPQKWRPGCWNWKVFWIFETKLVLGSAIFIRIGAVTILEIGVKFQCFFDLLSHSGQCCREKFSFLNLSHSAYLILL